MFTTCHDLLQDTSLILFAPRVFWSSWPVQFQHSSEERNSRPQGRPPDLTLAATGPNRWCAGSVCQTPPRTYGRSKESSLSHSLIDSGSHH